MTHEDAGHYAIKHPAGTPHDPEVARGLSARAKNGHITCMAAFEVIEALGVTPAEVGMALDLQEFRIVKCQLGLFGYSPEKRIVKPAAEVSEDMRERILRAADGAGITCAACWQIAESLGVPRMDVSNACERLGLKVTDCQLGAF